jgi:integrase
MPTTYKEDDMQGKRTRALDSRGRPVPGLYERDGRFIAGYKLAGKLHMTTLEAETLTEARRERESLLAARREGRTSAPSQRTFEDLFDEWQRARDLSERTRKHECELLGRHLQAVRARRLQDVSASELARLLSDMRTAGYSEWTRVAVYRILRGTFALVVRRGLLRTSPLEGLARSEIPKQRNARKPAVLDACALAALVAAGASERYRAALGLATYAGLRIGELRALRWGDVDFEAGTVRVVRSATRAGEFKPPKTDAGVRTVPLLPSLRRLLVEWRLRSPRSRPGELVVCTVDGKPMQERNLRRALDDAKAAAGLGGTSERLSWHSLRHSFASLLATDLELPATTLAKLTGHADAGFTLKVYARDGRDEAAVVEDVLERAATAEVGT